MSKDTKMILGVFLMFCGLISGVSYSWTFWTWVPPVETGMGSATLKFIWEHLIWYLATVATVVSGYFVAHTNVK